LIEAEDAAIAALISGDSKAGKLCRPLGDRWLAVPLESEDAFRKAVKSLGYVL
jgi:hypothetical protein